MRHDKTGGNGTRDRRKLHSIRCIRASGCSSWSLSGSRSPSPRGLWRRGLSKSATKARIEPGRARRIVDIPRFHSRPIPVRGAFVADLDTPPSRSVTGAPPAPPRRRPRPGEPGRGATGITRRRTGPVRAPPPRRSSRMMRRRLACRDAADPEFVHYAPSPFTTPPPFLVQRRVKGRSRRKRA